MDKKIGKKLDTARFEIGFRVLHRVTISNPSAKVMAKLPIPDSANL